MPVDMKEIIAQGAHRLLTSGRYKRITVKDIVDECNITRQTFYYHFEDVLDLFDWVIRRELDVLGERCLAQPTEEAALKLFFEYAISKNPIRRNSANLPYRAVLEQLLIKALRQYLGAYVEKRGLLAANVDKAFLLNYHVYAIHGMLNECKDDLDLDRMVQNVHLLMTGQAGFR